MPQDFAAKLAPYICQIAFALVLLFGATILIGSMILIRRSLSKKTPGQSSPEDFDRIATELDGEIRRLSDLRNRLDPKFSDSLNSRHAPELGDLNLNENSGPSPTVHGSGPSSETATLIASLNESRERIKLLELELAANKTQTANVAPGSGPAIDLSAVEDQHKAEVNAIKDRHTAQAKELNTKIANLETALSDYKIFEEDLSQVKRYKRENDKLAAMLKEAGIEWIPDPALAAAAAGKPPPEVRPLLTDAQMLNEIMESAESVEKSSVPPATESTGEPASAEPMVTMAAKTDVSKTEIDTLFDDLMNSSSIGQSASDSNPEPATPIAAEPTSQTAAATGPSTESPPTVDSDRAEALAESAANDDDLMAEFEKLLGGKP